MTKRSFIPDLPPAPALDSAERAEAFQRLAQLGPVRPAKPQAPPNFMDRVLKLWNRKGRPPTPREIYAKEVSWRPLASSEASDRGARRDRRHLKGE